MIWLAVLIIPFIMFGCEWLFWNRTKGDRWVFAAFGFLGLAIGVCVVGGWAITNYVSYPQHRAFYEVNSQNYAVTIDETSALLSQEKYISEALIPVEGSIEKMELAKTVSERIVEWRDAVNRYNRIVASLQYLDNNIFFDCMIPNDVHDLKLLSVGK